MAEKQKILIVDDDANIAELIELYLTKECFQCMQAHDGEEALKKNASFQPDLILLDIMLPGIDGYDVCREIRKTSTVPIIMLSAKSEDTDKIIGIPGGGFIRKSDKKAFIELFSRREKAVEAAIAEDVDGSGFVCDMFRYELANHEYIITYSLEETLDALGYSEEEVAADPKLANGLALARKRYMQEAEEKGWD